MKNPFTKISLDMTYEQIEAQMAQDLGLSCSLAHLRDVTATLEKRKRSAPVEPTTEEQKIAQLFAGKSPSERLAAYRANRVQVQNYLAGNPVPRGKLITGTKFVHRSYI